MNSLQKIMWGMLCSCLLLFGCDKDETASGSKQGLAAAEAEQQSALQGQPETEDKKIEIELTSSERTALEGVAPSIKIAKPKDDSVLKMDNLKASIKVSNWELGPDPGKHVHLIIDNHPYIAVRDVSKPLDLQQLAKKELGSEIEEGTHLIRVFPSRHNHESVKQEQPFDYVVFHAGKRGSQFAFDKNAPLLTYSRPKGCNPAGSRVLLDFYLHNVSLSEQGHYVQVTVNPRSNSDTTVETMSRKIIEWKPYYIDKLPKGKYQIKLQLFDADGNAVPGDFNSTEREIEVSDACP